MLLPSHNAQNDPHNTEASGPNVNTPAGAHPWPHSIIEVSAFMQHKFC